MKKSLKEASNIIKQFKWGSLLAKYFITFFLALMLPISLLNIVIYSSSQTSAKKELENFVRQSALISANTLNTSLNDFYNNYLLYLDDVNVQKYLSADSSDISSVNSFPNISEIRKKMDLHILSSTYLDSIYLYSFKSQYVISNTSGNQIGHFYDTNWLNYYNKCQKNYYITPQKTVYDNHISVCYELYGNNQPAGLIVFNFDLQRFQKTLFSNNKKSITSAILYNEDIEPVFQLGEYLIQSDFIKNNTISDDIQIKPDNKYIYSFIPLEYPNAVLQVSFITENLSMQKNNSTTYLLLGFIISFLVAGFLSIYLAIRFYDSISGIIMQITEANISNLPESEKADAKFDELSFISQNLARLIMKHSLLEDDLYHKIASLKRMQIMTLQSQLNPHFIFNTLNHISILTLDAGEKGELANSIIHYLSDLLRSSLANKQYIVDVKTEINYVKKYLEIERIKYNNKFDVKWDIDESILNCAVAKFMLQPIVENAFLHGIHKAKHSKKGLLTISAQAVNKEIVFQIKDNGAGIDTIKLEKIRAQLNSNDLPDSEHIGLCNVHQRVKLIFGEKYGITKIESVGGETIVELTIPKQQYN